MDLKSGFHQASDAPVAEQPTIPIGSSRESTPTPPPTASSVSRDAPPDLQTGNLIHPSGVAEEPPTTTTPPVQPSVVFPVSPPTLQSEHTTEPPQNAQPSGASPAVGKDSPRASSSNSVNGESAAPSEPRVVEVTVEIVDLAASMALHISTSSTIGDLRRAVDERVPTKNGTITFFDSFFGSDLDEGDRIGSLRSFEAWWRPNRKPSADDESTEEVAPKKGQPDEVPTAPRQPDVPPATAPAADTSSSVPPEGSLGQPREIAEDGQAYLEQQRRKCTEAGLDVKWCNDVATMDSLLKEVQSWEGSSVKSLKQSCASQSIPVDGLVEKGEITQRLRQVLVWKQMPEDTLRAVCKANGIFMGSSSLLRDRNIEKAVANLITNAYGGFAPTAREVAAKSKASSPQKTPAPRAPQEPKPKSKPATPKPQGTTPKSNATYAFDVPPKAKARQTVGPTAAKPKTGPTTPQNAGKAAQRSTARKTNSRFNDDSDDNDPDEDFKHISFKFSEMGPRCQKKLREFPNYSGDKPPPEAEESWTDNDLHSFFFSNGFIRPKKKKKKTKVLPKVLLNKHAQTLGLASNADMKMITKAFRQLALKYHPDKNQGEGTAEKFHEINEAYEAIREHFKELEQEAT